MLEGRGWGIRSLRRKARKQDKPLEKKQIYTQEMHVKDCFNSIFLYDPRSIEGISMISKHCRNVLKCHWCPQLLQLNQATSRRVPGHIDVHVMVCPAISIITRQWVCGSSMAEARAGPFPRLGTVSPPVPTLGGDSRHAHSGSRPSQNIGRGIRIHCYRSKSWATEVCGSEGLARQAEVWNGEGC